MRIYTTEIGLLPSVTSILECTRDKKVQDTLRKWEHKQIQIHGQKQFSANSQNYKDRGTEIHECIKQWELNKKFDPEIWKYEGNQQRWNLLKPFLKSIKIIHSEYKIFHTLKYAGTLDCIASTPTGTTLIDWKTSDRIKKRQWIDEHFIQCAAYKMGYEFLNPSPEKQINYLTVTIISPERLQIFEESDIEKYTNLWLERLQLFQAQYKIDTE